ncbi:MAG: macro domain-containing protein [Candidatus Baldrarchaeia archaeon]
MINFEEGNILQSKAQALVNPVNTKGAMGKGIAFKFKKAFPDMFKAYKKACDEKTIRIGEMHIYEYGEIEERRYIINFPTKDDWKKPSQLQYIERGLCSLVETIKARETGFVEHKIQSIAIPALGCGYGGLEWEKVLPLIESAFSNLPDVEVTIYPPQEKKENEHKFYGKKVSKESKAKISKHVELLDKELQQTTQDYIDENLPNLGSIGSYLTIACSCYMTRLFTTTEVAKNCMETGEFDKHIPSLRAAIREGFKEATGEEI